MKTILEARKWINIIDKEKLEIKKKPTQNKRKAKKMIIHRLMYIKEPIYV